MDVKEKLVGQMFVPENETDHSEKLWKKSQERKHSWCFLLLLFVVITYLKKDHMVINIITSTSKNASNDASAYVGDIVHSTKLQVGF